MTELDPKLRALLEASRIPGTSHFRIESSDLCEIAWYIGELETELAKAKEVSFIRGTVTGRFSSTSPNFEEIPRTLEPLPEEPVPQAPANTSGRGRRPHLGIPFKSGTPEYARAYYALNRETMLSRTRQYQKDHPEAQVKASMKWNKAHPERAKIDQKAYREKVKNELVELKGDPNEDKPRFEDIFGGNTSEDTHEGEDK